MTDDICHSLQVLMVFGLIYIVVGILRRIIDRVFDK
jgi:hypothetical protein